MSYSVSVKSPKGPFVYQGSFGAKKDAQRYAQRLKKLGHRVKISKDR